MHVNVATRRVKGSDPAIKYSWIWMRNFEENVPSKIKRVVIQQLQVGGLLPKHFLIILLSDQVYLHRASRRTQHFHYKTTNENSSWALCENKETKESLMGTILYEKTSVQWISKYWMSIKGTCNTNKKVSTKANSQKCGQHQVHYDTCCSDIINNCMTVRIRQNIKCYIWKLLQFLD